MTRKAASIVAMVTALAGSSAAQDYRRDGRPSRTRRQCVVTDAAGAFALMLRPGNHVLKLAASGQLIVVSSNSVCSAAST